MEFKTFQFVSEKAEGLFNDRNFPKLQSFLEELIETSSQEKVHWERENLSHFCHTYLGLVALEDDNIGKAKEHLLLSSKITKSPTIKTAGPNMKLAKGLLERGEKEVVIDYLKASRKYWNFLFRFRKLGKWLKAIKSGEIPNFGPNLKYHLSHYHMEEVKELQSRP